MSKTNLSNSQSHRSQSQQARPAQSQVVVVQQPVILTPSAYLMVGQEPIQINCPNCNQSVITNVTYESGDHVCLWVIIIALIGLCTGGLGLFFMCIPCCVDSCKDVHHFCPNCGTCVGIFKPRC